MPKPKKQHFIERNPGAVSAAFLALLIGLSTLSPLPHADTGVHAAAPGASTLLNRLIDRLHNSAGSSVSSADALQLLDTRAAIMTHYTTVKLVQNGTEIKRIDIRLQDHPTWIKIATNQDKPMLVFDGPTVQSDVLDLLGTYIKPPTNCAVQAVTPDDYGVLRTDSKCVAKTGQTFDVTAAVKNITNALIQNSPETSIDLVTTGGVINTAPELNMAFPDLLSTGISNFKGSPWGRIQNIHKAIEEKINGVVVPAGALFSFNKLLGPKVTQGNGWAMALGIFEGGDLRPTPGGGICQTSTTVYRAILGAGLPIAVQRNHSLFVHYYEVGGVGLDATVFYNNQDLQFTNDTGHPILIQARVDGNDVTVNFYGTSDGRSVTLRGPFVAGYDGGVTVHDRELRNNEIAWYRDIKHADGITQEELIVSRYKSVPGSVRKAILKASTVAVQP